MIKCCGGRKCVSYIECQREFWSIRARKREEEEIWLVCQREMKILL
jgi:hypothetical protein